MLLSWLFLSLCIALLFLLSIWLRLDKMMQRFHPPSDSIPHHNMERICFSWGRLTSGFGAEPVQQSKFWRRLILVVCLLAKSWRKKSRTFRYQPKPTSNQHGTRMKKTTSKLLYFEWSPPWHFKSNILTYILTFYLTFYLTSILIFYLAYLPAFYLVCILAFYLAYILAFYVAFFLAYILAFYVAFYVAYILAVFLAYILAFHLAAEVQQCPLSSEGPRLRSSRAHSDRKPAVEVQQCPLCAEVGEEIGEELARQKWTWKWRQRWWRRRRTRRRRRSRNSCDKI